MTAIVRLPDRCVICASPLRTAASREMGVGPECALALLVPQETPDWLRARGLLPFGVRDALAGHWRRSARRTASRLVARIAAAPESPDAPALREAVEALGFRRLAAAIGSRRPAEPAPVSEELRRQLRRRIAAERLHPDQGGDPRAFWELLAGASLP